MDEEDYSTDIISSSFHLCALCGRFEVETLNFLASERVTTTYYTTTILLPLLKTLHVYILYIAPRSGAGQGQLTT